MGPFIIFIIIVLVFGVLPRIIEAAQRQQAEAAKQQRRNFAEEEEEEPEKDEDSSAARKGDIQAYLEEMGIRTRPQPPQAPRQPGQQPPQRPQFVQPVRQRAPEPSREELARLEQARARQRSEQPQLRAEGRPQGKKAARRAAAKAVTAADVLSEGPRRRSQPVDLMALPAIKRLTPSQRAIIMADILGQPKALRDADDIASRWV